MIRVDRFRRVRAQPPMRMVVAAAALTLAAPLLAAEQEPAEADGLEPIIVTAEHRAENVQDVPVSVTAIGGDRIQDEAMFSLDRIGSNVPNLYLARNFGTTSGALVFLRGVGEGDSIFTNDPPVGIYVDDVIFPRATGSLFDLIDIERVEVLRGPQGTLYGRNTSGGAIKLVTARPDFDAFGGAGDVTVGSYGRLDARATANVPLASDLAVRVTGLSRHQDGWGRNLTDGARVNGQDVRAGRVTLLWKPDARFSLFAAADIMRERSAPRFPQQFLPDPARPGRFTHRFRAPDGDIDNFRSADTDPLNDTSSGGVSLRLDHQGDALTLTSITAYRELASRIGFDQTANAPGVGSNVILLQDQQQHQFSQELRAATTLFDGSTDLLAGLYYFTEHNDQLTAVSFATPAGLPTARFDTRNFFQSPSRGAGTNGNWSPYLPQLDTRSYSAFASATTRIGPRASLTAGLRYTDERKDYDVRFLTAPDATLVLADGREARRRIAERWTDLSPRATLDYRLGGASWEGLAYATVSKGFRSGSFDGRARNIDFVLNRQAAIAPETVWNYEAGLKSEWLDRRLRINIAYFVNDYSDIAFSAARANSSPPEIFRQNVGDARLQALEAEWSAEPFRGVTLGGWIATMADRFTRLTSSPGCSAFVPDEMQLDLRFTPALRYQLRGAVTRPIGGGRLRIGGDYSGASSYNIALCNEPQHRVTDAATVNAQVGYDLGNWSLILSATNLGDRRYNSGSVGTIGYPVEPRQLLATLRYGF